jgi:hypothetical protein
LFQFSEGGAGDIKSQIRGDCSVRCRSSFVYLAMKRRKEIEKWLKKTAGSN